MKLTTTLLAFGMLALAQNVSAQPSDVSITGTISPGICIVRLGGGGVADLGNITTRELNEDSFTDLPPVTMPLDVSCESEVRFALQGIDNTNSTDQVGRYGLGLTPDQEQIGDAQLNLLDVKVDGEPAFKTYSGNNGLTWSVSGDGPFHDITPRYLRGYAKEPGVTTGPAPAEALQGTLEVRARIRPTNALTIVNDVQIDGSVTLSLFYL